MSKLVNRFGPKQMDTIRTNHPECSRWRISCPENKLGKTYIKIRRIIPQSSECFLKIGNTPKQKMITENHPGQHLGHQKMCVNTDSYNHYSNIQCHCFFNAIASDYKQKSGFFICRCRHRARPHSCNPDPGDCKDVGAFVQGRVSGTLAQMVPVWKDYRLLRKGAFYSSYAN